MLRQYRGVNETISSLLLAYIAIAVFNHFVEGPLRDPASLNKPSTTPIGDANMVGSLPGLDVHWGLGFGLVFCLVTYVLVKHTTYGFALRIVGGNARAARLANQRKWEELVPVAQEAIKANPDEKELYQMLGQAQRYLGRYREAVNASESALRLDEEYPPARRIHEKAMRAMYQQKRKKK